MLLRVVLLSVFATVAWAQGSRKLSQDPYDPYQRYYSGVSTYAGNGYAAAGGGIGPIFGFPGFGPFLSPYPAFTPTYNRAPSYSFWPFFPVQQFVPWHKGPNVCVETKYMDEPEEMKAFLKDVRDVTETQEHLSESCRGTESAYVCYGRKMKDGESKFFVTKYQCCHGFIPAPPGQVGCVESKDGQNNEEHSPGYPVELEDSSRYEFKSRGEP